VKPSTHKTIVFAGFGCAGVLAALFAVALLFAPTEVREASFERYRDPDRYSAAQSAAALDSLRELVDLLSTPRARGNGPWPAGPELGSAALVAGLASGDDYQTVPLPLGDTFPEDARQRWQWLAARSWPVVDTLLDLVRRRAVPPDRVAPSSLAFRYVANRALSATHALLARARYDLDTGLVGTADEAVQAVLAIGRSLEQDSVLARTVLGARIERDAWRVLAGAPSLARRITRRDAAAELALVDSLAVGLRTVWRIAPAAGTDAGNCESLAALAREPRLPLAVRREMVLAIAYGWIYDPSELSYGVSKKRRDSVARLAADSGGLSPELADVVHAAEAAVRLGMTQRMARAVEYRMTRSVHAGL
jgi:hypothetical protein